MRHNSLYKNFRHLRWAATLPLLTLLPSVAHAQAPDAASTSVSGGLYLSPIWLTLIIISVAGWLYEVSWIKADARGVDMKPPRWVSAFLGGGLLLLFLTFIVHPLFSLVLIVSAAVGFLYYLTVRNEYVPTQHEILGAFLGGDEYHSKGASQNSPRELPHVDVSMTNEKGEKLEAFIAARPDFADSAEILGDLLAHACNYNAQELCLAPGTEAFNVFYTLYGVRQKVDTIPRGNGQKIVAGTAAFLGFKGSNQPRAQATVSLPEHGDITVEVEGMKKKNGAAISISLPDWHQDIYRGGLEGLGMEPEMVERVQEIVGTPGNTMLFSGPPSSGRTSTYHAAMGHIDIFTTEVTSLESNPIHELDQITRHEVNVGAEEDMKELLPAVFRHGADVIGVDEVTKPEVLSPLLEFVTDEGRLLATIKAASSAEALIRFAGPLSPTMTAKTLKGVTSQRLIRTLCNNCKEQYNPKPRLLKKLNIAPDKVGTWFRPVGCEQCLQTGYNGQTALFELLTVDKKLKSLIAQDKAQKPSSIKKAAGNANLTTLHKDALTKVQNGTTTLEEIRRVL